VFKKFRTRPIVIDAIQWTGDNYNLIAIFGQGTVRDCLTPGVLEVLTPHGWSPVIVGDYIAYCGIDFYPISARALSEQFEPVAEDEMSGPERPARHHLLAERSALEQMLANLPESSVIDRMSLESRKAEIEALVSKEVDDVKEAAAKALRKQWWYD